MVTAALQACKKSSTPSAICLALCISSLSFLFGQASPARGEHGKQVDGDKKTPKLSPKQQRGQKLLQSAEAESAGLQPDMRAFVLWKIAGGYIKSNPAKVDAFLRDAFTASLAIEDDAPETEDHPCDEIEACGIKLWLQRSILESMKSSAEVEALLAQARPEVRQQVTAALISRSIDKKDFVKDRQLIATLADQGEYPYTSAMKLILALPSGSDLDKNTIFAEAVKAYQRQSDLQEHGGGDNSLAGMVLRCWREVPPAMAEDAVDQILANAKQVDEGPAKPRRTISSPSGSIALNSQYQFALFQFLPVLEEIDKPKYDSLLRDNPDLRPILNSFPKGMQAVLPDSKLHPALPGDSRGTVVSVTTGGNEPVSVNALALDARAKIESKRQQIVAEANSSPRQAIAGALSLPEYIPASNNLGDDGSSPRAEVLLQIAQRAGKQNPAIAKEALNEARKYGRQASLMNQAKLLDQAASLYADLGDQDGTAKTIKEALQIAEKLYATDTDKEDPNQAFKGAWPSTNQWQHCIQTAARISPDTAEAIVAEIRDPEIATFEKIYFALALLDSLPGESYVAVIKKHNASFMTF